MHAKRAQESLNNSFNSSELSPLHPKEIWRNKLNLESHKQKQHHVLYLFNKAAGLTNAKTPESKWYEQTYYK